MRGLLLAVLIVESPLFGPQSLIKKEESLISLVETYFRFILLMSPKTIHVKAREVFSYE